MSGASYVLGVLIVGAIGAPLWFGARRVRTRYVPYWSGPQAWLADAVIAVALLETIAQALGTFAQFRRGPMVGVSLGSCIAVVAVHRFRRSRRAHPASSAVPVVSAPRTEKRPISRLGSKLTIALGLALVVGLPWLAQTVGTLRTGVLGYDSLNYHLPFAARFFQTGRVSSMYFTFPGLDTVFYPANAELAHAVGMLAFRRDLLSPFLNLGWLSLALLAAWCVGPYRNARFATLGGVGVLVASPFIVGFNGGRATNDLAAVALFMASVALFVHADGRRAPIALASLAAGMSLATKLTMVVPVVALTVGVVAIAGRGKRVRTIAAWAPGLAITGSYWYIRNLVVFGNPIPALHLGVGSVSLPSPRLPQPDTSFTVAHYLGDVHVWRAWFLPGLHDALGWAWPVIVGLAAAGWIVALLRGDGIQRMLGAVGVVSFLGYLVTPFGAGGPAGRPTLFANDIRFALPALSLGLVLLAIVSSRAGMFQRRYLPALLGIALVNDLAYSLRSHVGVLAVAILLELTVVAIAGVGLLVRSRSSRRWAGAFGCIVLVGAVAAGWGVQHSYFAKRYADVTHNVPYATAPRADLVALYGWVRHVSHQRIALAGLGISYPLFGSDLSNDVQYVGHRGPHGEFDDVATCAEWRRLLTAGHYDFVVVSANSAKAREPVQARWTATDRAATLVVRAGTAAIYRVHGDFHPDGCPAA